MKPPEGIVCDGAILREKRNEAFAWRRGDRFVFPCLEALPARGFENRGNDVNNVPRRVSQFTTGSKSLRPMDDQWCRDAAFMNPRLVAAERRVGQARPARPDAEERRTGSAFGVGIMAVTPDH